MAYIAICGAPCSGKTTVSHLVRKAFDSCEVVREYARTHIEDCGDISSIYEQYYMMTKQKEIENKLCSVYPNVISDSPVFLGYIYMLQYGPFLGSEKDKKCLIDGYSLAINSTLEYNYIFKLPRRKQKVDNVRVHGESDAIKIDNMIDNFIDSHGFAIIDVAAGTHEKQANAILRYMKENPI